MLPTRISNLLYKLTITCSRDHDKFFVFHFRSIKSISQPCFSSVVLTSTPAADVLELEFELELELELELEDELELALVGGKDDTDSLAGPGVAPVDSTAVSDVAPAGPAPLIN